ncbi:glycosyltransferase [Bacteroidales bacterium OttesenSCG-928-B11]|nr:glycosyltransferase [Bacteroidales bacterium OttesenSCG-928-C03]MDL2312783.1 glycosyltransferase [Bacteroidales bacterium OttesenSCG-928-B11]MDL2325867.1 glycosyltransferase [Bacteroidales bacterium OttesenSCG-928-A14]
MKKIAPRILMSVSNDLYTDPRVDKMCNTLTDMGFDVCLIGCRLRHPTKLEPRRYQTKRLRLIFQKGPLFFAEFNIKLFFYLFFKRFDILVANDLDTLLPNFLISRLRHKEIVYDSHEYYCYMENVLDRPRVRQVWHSIEKFCFPKLKRVITVSPSIAKAYRKEYGVDVKVVRNIPPKATPPLTETRQSLNLPQDNMIVLMQGNHIAQNRGAEDLVEAMPHVDKNAVLLFVGNGPVLDQLKERAAVLDISDRVIFRGRVSPERLFNYTSLADIGASFDRNVSPNHDFSLPNKIFEYIKAGTPVVISDLAERRAIVEEFQVGEIVSELTPENVAATINRMISDPEQLATYKANCAIASQALNWENEEKVVKEIYGELLLLFSQRK